MKYPITPEYLSNAPREIVALYEDLEAYILNDICSRLRSSGTMTNSAIEQIKNLQRRGYDLTEVEDYIRKTAGLTEKAYQQIWDEAVERNREYYDDLADKAKLLQDPLGQSVLADEIDALNRQTAGAVVNITQSLGFAIRGVDGYVTFSPIADTYQKVLDDAVWRVWSGTENYSTAIQEAIKRLTESGLQWVDYKTGWHNRVDVAARRAVMTGITQLSSKYSDKYMEEFGTPYMEVSAHAGARDVEGPSPWSSHKAWQGKVYSVNSGDIYPNVFEVCGWKEVDGLEGANCRHMHYPFVEGISERTYTDEELKNIDPPPFTFEENRYTIYEGTQKMRQIESAIRKTRREMIAFKAAGFEGEYTDVAIKERRLLEKYHEFSKASGLREQPMRFAASAPDAEDIERVRRQVMSKPAEQRAPVLQQQENWLAHGKARQAQNVSEAERYAREVLGVKTADYTGLAVDAANAMNETFERIFERFPKLRGFTNFLGSIEGRNTRVKKALTDQYLRLDPTMGQMAEVRALSIMRQRDLFVDENTYAQSWAPQAESVRAFAGVSLNQQVGDGSLAAFNKIIGYWASKGHFPKGTGSVSGVLWHEAGHQLDSLLGLRYNREILDILEQYSYDNAGPQSLGQQLSRYAVDPRYLKYREAVAEAVAEYYVSKKPRKVAREIGRIIEKQYAEKFGGAK